MFYCTDVICLIVRDPNFRLTPNDPIPLVRFLMSDLLYCHV